MKYIIRNTHDCDGLTECIIDELDRQFEIDGGIVFDFGEENREKRPNIIYKKSSLCMKHDNLEMEGIHEPVDRAILDAMLKYKSMAMHIMMRECNYNIYRYEYLEDLYYKELHYWNYLLVHEKIDFVLFMVSPHHVGEYILYALAQSKGIRTFVMEGIMVPGYFCMGTSIENIGQNIKDRYINVLKNDEVVALNKEFDVFYNNAKQKNTFSIQEKRKVKKEGEKYLIQFIKPINIARNIAKLFAMMICLRYKGRRIYVIKNQMRLICLSFTALFYNAEMDREKEYKKFAVRPDYSKPYIYFALQLTPEETTMPRAGEYKNQKLSIEMLAKGAEKIGAYVYVKEHWVQYHREKGYYKCLAQMPNVILIDSDINSGDLIQHAMAVSTQTGTCMIEALLHGKSVLYFGEGAVYKGMPKSYQIDSAEQLDRVLLEITQQDNKVTEHMAKSYLYALQEECVESYLDSMEECSASYNKCESAKKIVDCMRGMW